MSSSVMSRCVRVAGTAPWVAGGEEELPGRKGGRSGSGWCVPDLEGTAQQGQNEATNRFLQGQQVSEPGRRLPHPPTHCPLGGRQPAARWGDHRPFEGWTRRFSGERGWAESWRWWLGRVTGDGGSDRWQETTSSSSQVPGLPVSRGQREGPGQVPMMVENPALLRPCLLGTHGQAGSACVSPGPFLLTRTRCPIRPALSFSPSFI